MIRFVMTPKYRPSAPTAAKAVISVANPTDIIGNTLPITKNLAARAAKWLTVRGYYGWDAKAIIQSLKGTVFTVD